MGSGKLSKRKAFLAQNGSIRITAVLFFLWFMFVLVSSGYGFERQQPLPIPYQTFPPPPFSPKGEPGFCLIQYDTGSVSYYFPYFGAGDGIAVYIDPEFCGFDTSTYPFKLTNVHFYLYDPYSGSGEFVWPVEIKVSIVNADTTEDTLTHNRLRPGNRAHSKTFSIPQDSAYDTLSHPNPINLYLDTVFCVTSPFFLEITYTGGSDSAYPSLVMSNTSDSPETNYNWVFWKGKYREWYSFWEPWEMPGRVMMRVTGYPQAIDCNICWYWKPKNTKAPSGMPDFDQYQFGSDTAAFDAPTSVANCLVWLNAIPSVTNADSLIRLLSYRFHTNPSDNGGTFLDSIKAGLDSLFVDYYLNLYDTVLQNPTFLVMSDSLQGSANVVLLVGLWQKTDEASWYRFGGHYVSMAGVCYSSSWLAISDPALDHTEAGSKGRILPTHAPHPADHTLHNTKGFISHDAYVSDTISLGPYTGLWRLKDYHDGSVPWLSRFEGLNFQPEQMLYAHSYDSTKSVYAAVEYAIVISPRPPDTCWYWKPPTASASSGIPDFDQYQFSSDTSALCAPTAVANCLVWFNAIPSITNPDSLMRLLSDYFHTDPSDSGGTLVDSIKAGLDFLFVDYGLSLYDTVLQNPAFFSMVDSLKNSANVALLLGLWQKTDDTTWHRFGGHYVSMAGTCEDSSWLAISDPAVDNAEAGGKGRVKPPHNPHPDDSTLHNTNGYVSYDVYVSDTISLGPYAGLWRLKDYQDKSVLWLSRFEGQNFQTEQMQYAGSYDSTKSVYVVVEYAILIWQKPTFVTEEETEVPKSYELFQSYPNPFNNQAVIKYILSKPTEVTLIIYNILGQKVRTLVRKERQNGSVTVIWDGKDDRGRYLSSGIYFYQLKTEKFTQTKRMVLLK
jgi:hypothetical protein